MTTFHTQLPQWTEGVCGDGAAILRDGVMVPIEEVIARLNQAEARAALSAPEQGLTDEDVLRCLADIADECLLADHPSDVIAAGRALLQLGPPCQPYQPKD